jgi:hypothetical protein
MGILLLEWALYNSSVPLIRSIAATTHTSSKDANVKLLATIHAYANAHNTNTASVLMTDSITVHIRHFMCSATCCTNAPFREEFASNSLIACEQIPQCSKGITGNIKVRQVHIDIKELPQCCIIQCSTG